MLPFFRRSSGAKLRQILRAGILGFHTKSRAIAATTGAYAVLKTNKRKPPPVPFQLDYERLGG